MPNVKVAEPDKELQRRVRAGFTLRGTSFTAWCQENGIKHQNARKALAGTWKGPKAAEVVETILQAAGVGK